MGTMISVPTRVHKEFKKLLNDSKLNKINLGKANPLKPPTDSRMTLAISRLFKKYPQLKQELELSDFK
jgi:hypothetical protein